MQSMIDYTSRIFSTPAALANAWTPSRKDECKDGCDNHRRYLGREYLRIFFTDLRVLFRYRGSTTTQHYAAVIHR